MAIGTRRLYEPIDVKKALEASGLFDHVEQPNANNWPINAYDENNTLIVQFKWVSSNHRVLFYYNNGSSDTSGWCNGTNFLVAYWTVNGIMIKYNTDASPRALIITKDNNGEYTFIGTPSGDPNDIMAIRRSYTGTVSTSTSQHFTALDDNQTALVPFIVKINSGESKSYTPNAFWIPNSENRNIGWCAMALEGYQYVTNGYYALKDVSVTA